MSWPVPPHGFLGSQASTAATDNDTYQISRSLRFNSADSAYLSRTPSVAGNRKTWTWSGWVKRSGFGVSLQYLFCSNNLSAGNTTLGFYGLNVGNETLALNPASGQSNVGIISTQSFRDPSAWYHIVASVDTTQVVQENRFKLYVNGSPITSFSSADYTSSFNTDYYVNSAGGHVVGCGPGNTNFFNGYMAEVNFVDGEALTPSSFGETDATTGRWKAKAFSGNYGTNGFYLPFSNTSTGSNSVLTSEDFSAAMYTKDATTVTTNTTTAPNGTTTADTLTENSATATHRFFFNNLTYTNGVTFTSSIYVKANTRSAVALENWNGTAANYCYADLSTGTIISGSHASAAITSVGDGWYRISVSNVGTGPAACGSALYIKNDSSAGGLSYAGNGSGSVFIWGMQTEASSTVGPYFATNGTAIGSTLLLGADASVATGGYNNWVANNFSVTPGAGNDSLTDSPSNYGAISTTLVNDTYQISKSLRFNSGDSAYLSRYPSVAGNRKTWTWSGWVKKAKNGTVQQLFNRTDLTNYTYVYFLNDDTIQFLDSQTGSAGSTSYLTTSAVFKDPSVWYHIVFALDTTQTTNTNRVKLYVNGVQLTAYNSISWPNQDNQLQINTTNSHSIGSTMGNQQFLDGYLAEVNFVDGQALTPSSFGTRDINTYLWKPKVYTGTYGTNGFYLPFSDSSSTTTRNLLTYSEDFANGSWTNYQSTEASNVAVAPNGTTTADKLIPDAGALGGQFYRNYSAVDNTTYTFSVYAKAAEYAQLRLFIQKKATSATYDFADYDLTSATVTATYGSPTSTSIVAVGNGWHRVSISSNAGTGGTATPSVNIQHLGSAGNGSNGILLWGAQLEDSGTLGPYLRTDASATASTLRLGSDSSVSTGGYNSWFANNFSVSAGPGNDSLVDSPTYYGTDTGVGGEVRGNYATLNPLDNGGLTLANGNLDISGNLVYGHTKSTLFVSSGKWYFEYTLGTFQGDTAMGLANSSAALTTFSGENTNSVGYLADGRFFYNNSSTSYSSYTTGDVIGIAFDCATGKIWIAKNNTWQNSGNPAAGTGQVQTVTWPNFTPIARTIGSGAISVNFGQRPFIHAAPSGFRALRDYNKLPTPTGGEVRGNYCTLNFIDKDSSATLSNGNLDIVSSVADWADARGTMSMPSGKWYFEARRTGTASIMVGIASSVAAGTLNTGTYLYQSPTGYFYFSTGDKYNNNTSSAYGSAIAQNDYIGVAFDADARTLVFYKNGVSQGTAYTVTSGYEYMPAVISYSGSGQIETNFGQRPWAYDAPFGFKPLCTTLLPQPIVQKPSSYMDVVTYTGNNASRSITGLNFSPDLVWIKSRSASTWNFLFDAVRGATKWLASNQTGAEATNTTSLTSFDSSGFSLSTDPAPDTSTGWNANTATYVAWAWDKSPIAGMDIVSYSGTGVAKTVPHNLGVPPKMIIAKLTNSAGFQWPVYHSSLASASNYLWLNDGTFGSRVDAAFWGTAPTSSLFSVGTNANVNNNTSPYIAYCFAEVEGFSKFGSYTGNNAVDGPFVYCGFRPRFIMVRRTDSGDAWIIKDTARSVYNGYDVELYPFSAVLEGGPYSPPIMDYLSNGFKLRSNTSASNGSGTYIFAAFAESPFKYARAR